MEFARLPKENQGEWEAMLRNSAQDLTAERYPKLAKYLPNMLNQAFILRWQNGYDNPLDTSFAEYVNVFLDGLRKQRN
ncbi:hypothetical protein [Marinomonas epiphytica]